jgi:hypothetical protein
LVTFEFFINDAPDSSGFGEGETFVGTATPGGRRFTATLPTGLAGRWLTVTATDSAGNTSEFPARGHSPEFRTRSRSRPQCHITEGAADRMQ